MMTTNNNNCVEKIYIVVPCYNVEIYVLRCVESIENNSYKNFEIVCINDGSTDSTSKILHSLANKYKNIAVIEKENGGPSSARNAGLDWIKGKEDGFIVFIDADDWVDEDYFLTLLKLLKSSNVDIVTASYYYSSGKLDNRAFNIENDILLSSFDGIVKLFEDREIKSMSHHKLFKKQLWDNVRFPEHIFFLEDTATIFKLFLKSNSILLSNYCGYHYFQNNASSIMRINNSNQKILSGWSALRYLYEV